MRKILLSGLLVLVVVACSNDLVPNESPPPPVPTQFDNPSTGALTAETASKIFTYSTVLGGVRIDDFKSVAALKTYMASSVQASVLSALAAGDAGSAPQTFRFKKIGGKPVTEIAAGAFTPKPGNLDTDIGTAGVSVRLPETLTAIAPDAFAGVENLTVHVPATLAEIPAIQSQIAAMETASGVITEPVPADPDDEETVDPPSPLPQDEETTEPSDENPPSPPDEETTEPDEGETDEYPLPSSVGQDELQGKTYEKYSEYDISRPKWEFLENKNYRYSIYRVNEEGSGRDWVVEHEGRYSWNETEKKVYFKPSKVLLVEDGDNNYESLMTRSEFYNALMELVADDSDVIYYVDEILASSFAIKSFGYTVENGAITALSSIFPAVEEGAKILGCPYTAKVETGHGTHYLLSISFEAALQAITSELGGFHESNAEGEEIDFYQGSSLSNRTDEYDWVILEVCDNDNYDYCRLVESTVSARDNYAEIRIWHRPQEP
jgi:hypothetical protein